MKFTQILYKHHIGRMLRKHWYIQTIQRPKDYQADVILKEMGIPIVDANEFAAIIPQTSYPKFESKKIEEVIEPVEEKPTCYSIDDTLLFILGLPQACLLFKTVMFEDKLPDRIENLMEDTEPEVDNAIQRIIRTSTIFDAHQEVLQRRHDPERITYKFGRDYGITPLRKSYNLNYKLLNLCQFLSGPALLKDRQTIRNGVTATSFEKEGDLISCKMNMDIMVTSNSSLEQFCDPNEYKDNELPNIYPMHYTIGTNELDDYTLEQLFPIEKSHSKRHLHTIFTFYDTWHMQNITEREVAEHQILARALAKCFTIASSYAKEQFGNDVKDLPEPVSVQCVHSDWKKFHFSVFQLNTLNLDGKDGMKNFWWSLPRIDLYEQSNYEDAKPVFRGYNPEVFKRIKAFYNNR